MHKWGNGMLQFMPILKVKYEMKSQYTERESCPADGDIIWPIPAEWACVDTSYIYRD